MIRSTCLILATAASLVVVASGCAAAGEGDDDKKTGPYAGNGGNGGNGNGTGFGGTGQGGTGFSGTGQGGTGQGGTGQGGGTGFGGTGQGGGTGFGGTGQGGGTGFGGTGQGGGTGSGGTGQAGTGTAGTGAGATQGVADLIDDMELGTGSIPQTKGRVGAWYTYNDGTTAGMQTPTAGKPFVVDLAGFAGKCARTNGSGFTVWGAGMGVDLNNNGTSAKGVWNASAYTGVTFMAKSTSPFRVKVLIPATTPTAEGGTCTGAGCGNNHGFIVPASPSWTSVSVPFSSLMQETWADANPATFSNAAIIGIQFQVTKDANFDVAIDNLGFY
jgi:hypothetical protein